MSQSDLHKQAFRWSEQLRNAINRGDQQDAIQVFAGVGSSLPGGDVARSLGIDPTLNSRALRQTFIPGPPSWQVTSSVLMEPVERRARTIRHLRLIDLSTRTPTGTPYQPAK